MIDTRHMTARLRGTDLLATTLHLDAGRHALLGRKEDGVSALLACLAGAARPRRGTLTVLGGSPRSPKTRARVGWVPLGVRLPEVLRVGETLALARRIRGDAPLDAAQALAPLGLEGLAHKRVDTLSDAEARAVALAEALASAVVTVLLIEEPFVTMAASAVAALPQLLAAKKDACVVVTTASASDASTLATDFALFDRGRMLRIVTEPPLRARGDVARIHVVADDARALAAALATHPEVEHLELSANGIIASGPDAGALAGAVNEAIVVAEVDVQRIEPEPTTFEALRAEALADLAPRPAASAGANKP